MIRRIALGMVSLSNLATILHQAKVLGNGEPLPDDMQIVGYVNDDGLVELVRDSFVLTLALQSDSFPEHGDDWEYDSIIRIDPGSVNETST